MQKLGMPQLFLGILAVWRLTHLLQAEDGPWDVIVHLRQRVGTSFWGSLMDCFYCLSLWVAFPFSVILGYDWKEWLALWPALSAGSILIERLTSNQEETPPVWYVEDDEEVEHELLRW
jgi:hypothetical protein